ncbi:MAG: DHH family phosphoesterase [Thermodesulfobacteriota bacterium]
MAGESRDLNTVADIVKKGKSFFLGSHKDPDGDAIGSILALGEALNLAGKNVVLFNQGPITNALSWLPGVEKVVKTFNPGTRFDAVIILDCATLERLGSKPPDSAGNGPLINIDHHENNTYFGDLNIVEGARSSTGELIYRLIQTADLPMSKKIAENIFVAIQTDTGSFKYDNATKEAFLIASEMFDWGVDPWKISRRVMNGYTVGKLRLLADALNTIEVHHGGKLGLLTVTRSMCSARGTDPTEVDRFVDFPRYINGVEMAALIRECENGSYHFSLRSNDSVNVADLAAHFGGGGHRRAAAFTRQGCLDSLKHEFLSKALVFLDNVANHT